MKKPITDLIFTFFNMGWRFISGPLVLFLVPLYLSEKQQGYWYLFGSISALSTFADLGFSNIILQFTAHEFAFLEYENGELTGDVLHLKRLGSLFNYTVKWISKMCIVVFPIILMVGLIFFYRDSCLKEYLLPWLIYSFGSMVYFFCNSVLSFIEGLNQISKIQKFRLYTAVSNTFTIFIGLVFGWSIYALSFGMLISSVLMFFTLFVSFKKTFRCILKYKNEYFNWKKEVVPLFKRYFISFISGYFLFQIYTPLMHYFHGPINSGKVGLSMSIVLVTYNFSSIWISTIIPKINMLIELKNWKAVDTLILKRLLITLVTYLFIFFAFVLCFFKLENFLPFIKKIIDRMLPFNTMCFLFAGYFLQLLVNTWAIYLRGHKEEPYCFISMWSAFFVFGATLVCGFFLPYEYFFLGFLLNYIWSLPIYYIIYKRKLKLWHKDV